MSDDDYFRIGPGYVEYWIHETTHWTMSKGESVAVQELGESLVRLISKRDGVQDARRAFFSASSLTTSPQPSTSIQHGLFQTTQEFFHTYYSTLSAFAAMLVRFRAELGNVPHRSNSKLIEWIEPLALWRRTAVPALQEARQFRALIDHRASHQPFQWGTTKAPGDLARIFLHGPGSIPSGAMPRLDLDEGVLPEGDTWIFVAPDEDIVLSALAVQLNAIFPRIQSSRIDHNRAASCGWNLELTDFDPPEGYPILSHIDGVVTNVDPQGPTISAEDSQQISDILAKYSDLPDGGRAITEP